jgi:phage terminase large subunit-like protein
VLCKGGKIEFASLAPGHNAFRGKGYSLACIDECSFVRNLTVTIERNLTPSLSQYAGRLLLISSPFGYNEFYDWYRIAERDGVVINGSSRLNETLPAGAIEEERRILTPLAFEAEIEGRFCALEGTCMKKSEIRYGPLPSREEMVYLSIGLDLAISEKKSADYTAICICSVDDRGRRWVAHMAQWRARFVDTVQKLLNFVSSWSPNIIVMESVAQEGGVAAEQLREYGLPIHSVKPFADKTTRFSVHSGRYQRGEIWHNELLDPELEGQCLAYPHGRGGHDDVFDALTYGLAGLDSKALALLSSGQLSAGKRAGLSWGGGPHERRPKIIWNSDGSGYARGLSGGLVRYNADGSVDENFH